MLKSKLRKLKERSRSKTYSNIETFVEHVGVNLFLVHKCVCDVQIFVQPFGEAAPTRTMYLHNYNLRA